MYWIGTQDAVISAAALCDAAAEATVETRAGVPVPDSERVTQCWAVPSQCAHCSAWYIPAPPDAYGVAVPAGISVEPAESHT